MNNDLQNELGVIAKHLYAFSYNFERYATEDDSGDETISKLCILP